jgi:phage FluMu protein Com
MLMTFPNAARVQPKINIRDYRCQSCGRLLFRAHIPYIPGVRIEIRCKCTRMIIVESGEVKNVTKEPGQ